MPAKRTVGACPVPLVADRFGQVENDGHRQAVILTGQRDQRFACLGLHVGGIDNGQPACRQPLGGDEVQHLKGVVRRRLLVLVVANESAAVVG